ncbi:MAG TPA: amidohydrolase family protein [Bryobacteraceae bacterium]|nr:amidohydrolase family protein [Bryobacteraceae bacterium]
MRRIIAFALCATSAMAQGTVAVRFGKLWDGGKVVDGALVVIEGDRIRSVTGGDPAPPSGATVVDWSRYYGLPGLIDVHTHMTYYWDRRPGTRPLGQGNRMAAVTVFLAQENARKTLDAGVTTVRDLGSSEYTDIAMRDLINMGAMVGPRMFVCGYGLSTPARPVRAGQPPAFSDGTAETPDEVRKAVRRQIAAGADVIKMYGSVGGFDNVGTQQTFTYDEMKAAVDVAHTMGKKIAIHSYGPEGGRDAVHAGADSVEHAVDLDDATLAEMVKRGTYYVPTIDHNRYYVDARNEYQFPPGAVDRLNAYIQRNFETAKRAYKAGVKFAMGSDAVFTMFGQNTRELAWFVKVGMSPEEALKTATVNAGDLLGKSNDVGWATPGHFADLIAVEGDPLSDIQVAIDKVRGVMKGGKVVK